MPEPQEHYTVDINILTDLFLDGMLSGLMTVLINGADMEAGEARAEAVRVVYEVVDDPAVMETIRDTMRARINHGEHKQTVLQVKGFGNDDN